MLINPFRHMAMTVAADTKRVYKDTSLIREYTMKIAEQLTKQDEVLKQIAWIRAVVSQRQPQDTRGSDRDSDSAESVFVMDGYLDSVSDYAKSVYESSISDDVAEEMQRLSLEAKDDDGSNMLVNEIEPPSDSFDSMTIVIGNTHRLVAPEASRPDNKHLWSFYLSASEEAIIEEVLVELVSDFRFKRYDANV